MANQQRKASDMSYDTAPERPIDEIVACYTGEWVVIKVTGVDEAGAINRGQLVEHSPSRTKITRAAKRLHKHDPQARTYVDRGGTRMSAKEFWRYIETAIDREYVNARCSPTSWSASCRG